MSLRRFIRGKLRAEPRIQFTESEALLVGSAVRQFPRCRFLVFGVGHDSAMWSQINSGGTTVFLEHNKDWIAKVQEADPLLDIRAVEYTTRITQWREILDQSDSLTMELPSDIRKAHWDVVLVDAPNGFIIADEYPRFGSIHGRMQSIYAASGLVDSGGFIFVHDAQREVENASCNKILADSCQELFRFQSHRNNGHFVELRCFSGLSHARTFSWPALHLQMLAIWLRFLRRTDLQERWQDTRPAEHQTKG